MDEKPSFWVRHEFLLRRLHSLTGLVPVGAYMVIHLLTNASIWNGPASFQAAVYQIHSLGRLLPVIEWTFIFIPILFHGLYGLVIISESQPNSGTYPYVSNIRYTLQRATGLIAFLFIGWHVFHMHGWIHSEAWRQLIDPWGGQFAPFNAASTATAAMQQSMWVSVVYVVGVAACVYHLANGIWTMGITWGLWTSPAAQRRADWVALAVGVVVFALGISAWSGFALRVDADDPQAMEAMRAVEQRMLERRLHEGLVTEEEARHKTAHRSGPRAESPEAVTSPGQAQEP
ncbi:MAG: succinate dehydrogenase [Pirellulaceae bacterium]|nr:MAG: succinate dehydrogenase [Pirellulaceae bacterium]